MAGLLFGPRNEKTLVAMHNKGFVRVSLSGDARGLHELFLRTDQSSETFGQ